MIPEADLRALTNELLLNLERVALDFPSEPQHSMVAALAAVASFVADIEAAEEDQGHKRERDLAWPLMRLAQAMASATEGLDDPLLARTSPRSGVPIYVLMGRAEAAGTLHVLTQTGLSERAAAKLVVRKIGDADLFADGRGDAETRVINWRKQIRGVGESRPLGMLPIAPEWQEQQAGLFNLTAAVGEKMLSSGWAPGAIRTHMLTRLRRRHPAAPRHES